METSYTVEFFIKKFEAIPEELWCENYFQYLGRHCAQGFCGVNSSNCLKVWSWHDGDSTTGLPIEALALNKVMDYVDVGEINNGDNCRYQQTTPKQRILAALRDIQKLEQSKVEPEKIVVPERIVYVSFDSSVRELQKTELSEN